MNVVVKRHSKGIWIAMAGYWSLESLGTILFEQYSLIEVYSVFQLQFARIFFQRDCSVEHQLKHKTKKIASSSKIIIWSKLLIKSVLGLWWVEDCTIFCHSDFVWGFTALLANQSLIVFWLALQAHQNMAQLVKVLSDTTHSKI